MLATDLREQLQSLLERLSSETVSLAVARSVMAGSKTHPFEVEREKDE